MSGTEPRKTSALFRLCFMAVYGALIFALKMVMAPLPNIEPVTLLILLAGAVFKKDGLAAVFVYVICEILVWGPGLWNISYLLIWPILELIAWKCRRIRPVLFWAALALSAGFSFGFIGALVFGLISGWQSAIIWWQAGLIFDLIHAAANFILTLILFIPLRNLLTRLAVRYGI